MQMALKKQLLAGTTATVALNVDGKLLVANVGDSKALLCSEKIQSSGDIHGILLVDCIEALIVICCDLWTELRYVLILNYIVTNISRLQVMELTEDHHPDRDDEKARITAAGGFVSLVGVPRVNGILAVSRSIGDVYLKRYGVTAEPEITGWHHLNASDVFLVVASDGIFESLSPQEVCTLLLNTHIQSENEKDQTSSKCLSSLLAERIVNMAFEKGSTDNLSAILVPLKTDC